MGAHSFTYVDFVRILEKRNTNIIIISCKQLLTDLLTDEMMKLVNKLNECNFNYIAFSFIYLFCHQYFYPCRVFR